MSKTISSNQDKTSVRIRKDSKRKLNYWAKNPAMEDYALQYEPSSFRKWTEYVVATTVIGGIAYIVDFAILTLTATQ